MVTYKWDGVSGEGETLIEAIENEFEECTRNSEYTTIGKQWQKDFDADVEYWTSSEGDSEYKEYCDAYGVEVPKKDSDEPKCPNCHHKLLSRWSWAYERADNGMNGMDYAKEFRDRFNNPEDNEEVAKYLDLDPDPIEVYDDEEQDWTSFENYVAAQI